MPRPTQHFIPQLLLGLWWERRLCLVRGETVIPYDTRVPVELQTGCDPQILST